MTEAEKALHLIGGILVTATMVWALAGVFLLVLWIEWARR